MIEPIPRAAGGHELPLLLSGTAPGVPQYALGTPQHAPYAPPPKKRRAGLVIGILTGAAAAAALGAVQLGANLGYDDAQAAFESEVRSTTVLAADAHDASADLEATSGLATLILDGDSGSLIDAASRESLTAALADAAEVTASADDILGQDLPRSGEKPTWFWDLFPASGRLDDQRESVAGLGDELEHQTPAITASADTVDDAAVALLSTAAAAAGGFEAAHLSARNDDVIALRDAASTIAATTSLDQGAVDSFVALQDAAAQVIASEQAELAEKAGPLQPARLEVEAFARSLAPGVLLEFDWNPIVNGVGESGSMGGLTTWWWDEPDRAVIELSNSVAQQWPSIRSKSLVAHEVGHAISVKCEDQYDSSTQDSIEHWATAWAISMGFADDANGVWAYGYPPQSYIDAAYGCR